MSVKHLDGLAAVRERYYLHPQSRAHYRQFASRLFDEPDDFRGVGGISRSFRYHESVRLILHYLLVRCIVRDHYDVTAVGVKLLDKAELSAAIGYRNIELGIPCTRKPDILRRNGGYLSGRERVSLEFLHAFADVPYGVRYHSAHRAFVAYELHYLAGVDSAQSRRSRVAHDFRKRLGESEVGRHVVIFAHHHTGGINTFAFVIVVGHAVVTDKRITHYDDTGIIDGVRQYLLITDHGGVEHYLRNAGIGASEAFADIKFAVLQHKHSFAHLYPP